MFHVIPNIHMDHNDPIVRAADVVAAGTVISTCLNWLPDVAALFAIVWYIFCIVDSPSGQKIIHWLRGHDEPKQ